MSGIAADLPPVDNEGFLLEPSDWSETIATTIAQQFDAELSADHWAIVNFVRDYYEYHQQVPETRRVLQWMKTAEEFGKERATRKGLYKLFPHGYGQQACKIAGMRKPLKLMLDV
uniref:Sulfurtransferase n=1 Tax=uncultured Thiotrichaceae bacterium TaxID=298394 RepID=A0A6S6UFH5_9GAMM|nr:MAG: Sulfurtransferase [uncultured Thiotrichaceae bacterium]